MLLESFAVIKFAKSIWNKIPPRLRDWSKSEVLNFVQKKAPGFFNFCKEKIRGFWSKIPNSRVKEAVDRVTSKFLDLNDKIPPDVKQRMFEEMTGAQYIPPSDDIMENLSDVVQTDDEKKAAAMQMSYLVAVLGEINQKQELMLNEYMNSLKMTEKLKQEIIDEMQEAEKELAKFAEELGRLDKEFERLSAETAKARKEANDIIDQI